MKVRSTGPGAEVFDVDPKHPDVNMGDCCPKGYQLRPHIVWFGEAVPEIEKAEHMTTQADIFLIIGTSMQVYPAAGLINNVKAGVPVYLIDPHEVNHFQTNIKVIQKGGSEGMKEFIEILKTL